MVRTAYLDQAFEGLDTVPDQIDLLEARIVRRSARLERWASKKPTEARLAKIEKQSSKLEADNQLLATSKDLLNSYQQVDFPKDEFFVTLTMDLGRGIPGFEIDVVDSPYDDSFTGGDHLKLRASATGRKTQFGTSSHTSTSTLANGDYWPEGKATMQLISGSSIFQDTFTSYPQITVQVALDDGEWGRPGPLTNVLHTQAFDLTTYFG